MYKTLYNLTKRFFSKSQLFKYGFNLSPMYRRSTGRVVYASDDILNVTVKIPLSWKNRNYVGTIFGGSLFSATDPVFMIQLIHILGDDYVVWDKSAEIKFRRPASKNAFAKFIFTPEEILAIKNDVAKKQEIDLIKKFNITDGKDIVFCELEKVIYIADKSYYREKRRKKKAS